MLRKAWARLEFPANLCFTFHNVGKMNFYLAAVDDLLRHADDSTEHWADFVQDE
jgi:hypothetical protein